MARTSTSFYVGGRYIDASDGKRMVDQAFVQRRDPVEPTAPYPIVMIHGGGQSAMNFETPPDGRPGWSDFFVDRGYTVYLLDHPGMGRSPYLPEAYGPTQPPVPVTRTEQYFTAPATYGLWPQAARHTQWPGTGRAGDPVFDQFYATQVPGIGDAQLREALVRAAGAALLDEIGPAIILTHSMSGPYGWQIADARPDLVPAVVAVEPGGPPFISIEMTGPPAYFEERPISLFYGVTANPITYDPPLPEGATGIEYVPAPPSDDPDRVRGYLQAEPARALAHLREIPVLVVTSPASYHAAYDHCTVAYLRQAGVDVDFVELADRGIEGNGHMMMLEQNSDEIAALIAAWVEELPA